MYERNKVCRALKARSVALRQRAQRSVFVTLDRKLIGSGGGGGGGGGGEKKKNRRKGKKREKKIIHTE